MRQKNDRSKRLPRQAEELSVVELDERLEFGAAIIDSDLQADTNTGCPNIESCKPGNDVRCTNEAQCL